MPSASALLCSVLALVAVCSARPLSAPPSFCHGIDCPNFTVLNKTSAYETRAYPESYWVSTSFEGMNFTYPEQEGFQRLFAYISGQNVPNMKVEMTAPVTTNITPGSGPFCDNTYEVSFFVPFALQPNKAPQPSNPQVYLRTQPAFTAYVSVFGGFAQETDVTTNAAALAEALQKDNISFNDNYYLFAGYDGPYRVVGRHNEIWFTSL